MRQTRLFKAPVWVAPLFPHNILRGAIFPPVIRAVGKAVLAGTMQKTTTPIRTLIASAYIAGQFLASPSTAAESATRPAPSRGTQVQARKAAPPPFPAFAEPAASANAVPAESQSAFQPKGLASAFVSGGANSLRRIATELRHSIASLLDWSSVRAWWAFCTTNPQKRIALTRSVATLLAIMLPALLIEWAARHMLRRIGTSNARCGTEGGGEPHQPVLRCLSGAAIHAAFKIFPLLAFVLVAIVLISTTTDNDSVENRALYALIDIYVLCRTLIIACDFFIQPEVRELCFLPISDVTASVLQRRFIGIIAVVGGAAGMVEVAFSLGLSATAHLALLKVVALIGHAMVAVLILQCPPLTSLQPDETRTVAHPFTSFAHAWGRSIAAFLVMALWLTPGFDGPKGYQLLRLLCCESIVILFAAHIVSNLALGALGRTFQLEQYPLLRSVIGRSVGLVAALALLQIWGVNVWQFFQSGTMGHRLALALLTIGGMVALALFVWNRLTAGLTRQLNRWTSNGDTVRAARLRTLMPMLRTLLLVMIALLVVLAGLSELGVNTTPLLAGASIFGVALGFGSQKFVQDFITGIFLMIENAMQVGDWITLSGISGTVEHLSIRTVHLRGGDGSLYIVPFSSVTTVSNANRGIGNAAVSIRLVYGQDVDLAARTLKEIGIALREDERFKNGILSDFIYCGVDQLDGQAVTLIGEIQCSDTARWQVQREFNRCILDKCQQYGIKLAGP